MKYLAEHGMPIKGMNNHKAESKSVLKDRLSEIAKSPTYIYSTKICFCLKYFVISGHDVQLYLSHSHT